MEQNMEQGNRIKILYIFSGLFFPFVLFKNLFYAIALIIYAIVLTVALYYDTMLLRVRRFDACNMVELESRLGKV
jgi:hypothetical protein